MLYIWRILCKYQVIFNSWIHWSILENMLLLCKHNGLTTMSCEHGYHLVIDELRQAIWCAWPSHMVNKRKVWVPIDVDIVLWNGKSDIFESIKNCAHAPPSLLASSIEQCLGRLCGMPKGDHFVVHVRALWGLKARPKFILGNMKQHPWDKLTKCHSTSQ